jgi:hypothetical protein
MMEKHDKKSGTGNSEYAMTGSAQGTHLDSAAVSYWVSSSYTGNHG